MKKQILPLIFSLLLTLAFGSCGEKSEYEPEPTPVEEPEPEPEPDPIPKKDGEVVTTGAVDLGLSVMWSSCNLGAEYCYEYGSQYPYWGDTSTNCLLDICGTEFDQATQELGWAWQLPSKDQMQELFDKCRWSESTYRGNKGYIVTGPSGNAIFLRFEWGYYSDYVYYWTGSCNVKNNEAYVLFLRRLSNGDDREITTERRYHSDTSSKYYLIRPVWISKFYY